MDIMDTEGLKLKKIIELDSELNRIQDVDILLERILLEARKAVNADAGSIYVKKDEKLTINYSQNDTLQATLAPGEKLVYNIFSIDINQKSISGYAAATGTLLNIEDVYRIPASASYGFDPTYDRISGYRTTSMLTVPLVGQGNQVLGVLQVINAKDASGNIIPFDRDSELFISHFAYNASTALQRAQMTRAILLRMIRMAELRDPKETGPHVNRVAAYGVELFERWARRRNMSAAEVERMRDMFRMAAMLHDVGKVAISDLILKKPGKLTTEEYEIMKTHTISGACLFTDRQSEFDALSSQVALTHHENWDGTGYPGAIDPFEEQYPVGAPTRRHLPLKGEQIPIWGRIVAVADVYDALTCKRVYKEAWSETDVLDEMKRLAGTKFDPELIDIFLEMLPVIRQIAARFPDFGSEEAGQPIAASDGGHGSAG